MSEFPDSDKFAPLTDVSPIAGGGQDEGERVRPELEFVSWGEFTMDASGLTTSKISKKGATSEREWIASAFEVLGACRDPLGCGWGSWLQWKDPDQRSHTHYVTNAAMKVSTKRVIRS